MVIDSIYKYYCIIVFVVFIIVFCVEIIKIISTRTNNIKLFTNKRLNYRNKNSKLVLNNLKIYKEIKIENKKFDIAFS